MGRGHGGEETKVGVGWGEIRLRRGGGDESDYMSREGEGKGVGAIDKRGEWW